MHTLLVRSLFLLVFVCFSTNLHAALIRYDVKATIGLDTSPLGYMVFDVNLEPNQIRNIWGGLIQWDFSWEGLTYNEFTSTASLDTAFRIDTQTLRVVSDGSVVIPGSAIQCALFGLCPYLSQQPLFSRDDGNTFDFSGFNNFGIPTVGDTVVDQVSYSATRIVSVPLVGTMWLLGLSLWLLAVTRSEKA